MCVCGRSYVSTDLAEDTDEDEEEDVSSGLDESERIG